MPNTLQLIVTLLVVTIGGMLAHGLYRLQAGRKVASHIYFCRQKVKQQQALVAMTGKQIYRKPARHTAGAAIVWPECSLKEIQHLFAVGVIYTPRWPQWKYPSAE
eukprot:Gregarina_sp_Poly_1__1891@NODE_1492_length_4004_cov_60_929388_g988_i0_p4_GENE_NODE_1492_length_4004_cov_60_929388_g988_i0NODE_1492_length_4004_cov_60_929388_g988_i0_p4_ORF_typecomplete_len105_score6_77DUF3372/PF11852_8/0_15_NODE_1492_length_4004_cov_60_929388_g988_i030344